MKESGNILFCGVGGQGILLASEITAYALLEAGFDAKKSEVHGMAQRGGSVVAHLRFGEKVYSPLIDLGQVDFMVAFEMMESVRYLPFLHEKSQVIVNTHTIAPPSVATGKTTYPENLLANFSRHNISHLPIDGAAIGHKVGEIRAANVALVGALSNFLPVQKELFLEVMKKRLPTKILDVNLKAFAEGSKVSGQ
ncbi:MAG: indolepyruvate oxidoreductase subunit beta [Desulfobulbaceae bacterium]|nr:indolepyruvate oxidoreductase subunit beta [Desulfobulbaceae bacterium]MCK5341607.1 indolepyruvate oxidoreductase subunit beta [Desulfobulbaceae bacterium]MCK5404438.1 indolepyruvate oxidoreductase subunit beta [Desulfobulbaceae bacterium]